MMTHLVKPTLRFNRAPEEGGGATPETPAEQAPTEETPAQAATEGAPAPEGEQPAEEAAKPEEEGEPDEAQAKDVAWLQRERERLGREAANYRRQLREAQAALEGAKTVEEFEAATKDLQSRLAAAERELLVERVANAHKLPQELAELLKGNTKEELEEHAKTLARFVPAASATPPEPDRLAGGLDGAEADEPFDPVKQAAKARRRY